jgi:hypothetical protein
VVANGTTAWVLRVQQKDATGKFIDRALALGLKTEEDRIRSQFVTPADTADIVVRVEQVIAQTAPASGFAVQRRVVWSTGEIFARYGQGVRPGSSPRASPWPGDDGRQRQLQDHVTLSAFDKAEGGGRI